MADLNPLFGKLGAYIQQRSGDSLDEYIEMLDGKVIASGDPDGFSGIEMFGQQMFSAVMFPVATLLIGELGWRTTFLFYGMFALLFVVPTVLLVVVNRPEDMGLHPDGAARLPPSAKADAPEPLLPLAVGDQMIDHPGHLEWSARSVLRESNFWLIALVISLNFSSIGAVLTHIVPHATDLGFTPERAGFVGSVMPGLGIVGKVFFGWLADRNDPRAALWLACLFQALGLVLFLNASSYSALLLAGAVFGLGMGGLIPIWGVLLGASFGRHRFGRVMGLMSVFMLPIQMVGVPFAGYMFDLNGSYTVVFQTFVGFYVVAMLALFFLRVPEKAHRS